jgi:selenide,water dikinase
VLSEVAHPDDQQQFIVPPGNSEDAAILSFPPGKAMVQTVDFLTPIVNDPQMFGQIAAANALSDVYAMGGQPYCALNIVCFPGKSLPLSILKSILKGGLEKIRESGALMAGGHSVEDEEMKYGLAVTGTIDQDRYASNQGCRPGDQLLLTKPLGTGILATAVKAGWEGSQAFETLLGTWAARLNRFGGEAIQNFGLRGATDVTGFGLGGHALEMARASEVRMAIWSSAVPVLDQVKDLAAMGLIPAGSYANKHFCESLVSIAPEVDPLMVDIIFDAQTSGGLILSVPADRLREVRTLLTQNGDLAAHIGEVHSLGGGAPGVSILQ